MEGVQRLDFLGDRMSYIPWIVRILINTDAIACCYCTDYNLTGKDTSSISSLLGLAEPHTTGMAPDLATSQIYIICCTASTFHMFLLQLTCLSYRGEKFRTHTSAYSVNTFLNDVEVWT